jgi:hypothetical protein
MKYNIKNHPTLYNDVIFRSRLEARWAAFFDLVGWNWEYEPLDLFGWTPDFRVTIPCENDGCNGHHILLVEVKPYFDMKDFQGHPCMNYPYGFIYENGKISDINIPADASAAFGANPDITYWEMVHGGGGGTYNVDGWVDHSNLLWKLAGTTVQYQPRKANNEQNHPF